jgi:hypothetical protein
MKLVYQMTHALRVQGRRQKRHGQVDRDSSRMSLLCVERNACDD